MKTTNITEALENLSYAEGYQETVKNAQIELLDLVTKTAALEAENAALRKALEPFAHPDLCKILSGNTNGDESIVFGRDKANLKLKHFIAARALLEDK